MFLGEIHNAGVGYGYVLRQPDGGIAAFCTVWLVAGEVHINNLAVRPDCRRAGAGLGLLGFVLDTAASLGVATATLEVRRSNEAALKLYEKLGFVVAGVRKGYYDSPVEDALILWRDAGDPRRDGEGSGAA